MGKQGCRPEQSIYRTVVGHWPAVVDFQPTARVRSLYDVCGIFDLSPSTVRRISSNDVDVQQLVDGRFIEVIFVPCRKGRSLVASDRCDQQVAGIQGRIR